MHGAWWWIDRWRQSTAFLKMTAEQRGLYRDLLDALWLFPDHCIPDERAVLMKAAGSTSEEWDRSGAIVLLWMTKTPTGWTHETALEVIHQGQRRARNQKAYRRRAGNGAVTEPITEPITERSQSGHFGANKPDSPSPSPSPSQSLKKPVVIHATKLSERDPRTMTIAEETREIERRRRAKPFR